MKISKLMTRQLVSVSPLDSIETAIPLLRKRHVRHLLVIDQHGHLRGILSDRDVKRAMDPVKTKKRMMSVGGLYFLMEPILVEEIMTANPLTVGSSVTASQAAQLMIQRKIGALPVVEQNKVVGIITESDLLRYFAEREAEAEAAERNAKARSPAKPVKRKTKAKKRAKKKP